MASSPQPLYHKNQEMATHSINTTNTIHPPKPRTLLKCVTIAKWKISQRRGEKTLSRNITNPGCRRKRGEMPLGIYVFPVGLFSPLPFSEHVGKCVYLFFGHLSRMCQGSCLSKVGPKARPAYSSGIIFLAATKLGFTRRHTINHNKIVYQNYFFKKNTDFIKHLSSPASSYDWSLCQYIVSVWYR